MLKTLCKKKGKKKKLSIIKTLPVYINHQYWKQLSRQLACLQDCGLNVVVNIKEETEEGYQLNVVVNIKEETEEGYQLKEETTERKRGRLLMLMKLY